MEKEAKWCIFPDVATVSAGEKPLTFNLNKNKRHEFKITPPSPSKKSKSELRYKNQNHYMTQAVNVLNLLLNKKTF